eukprot:TRINITY_DN9296_c0_g1_i4.p4 TRINITY_DN9296_c0_g1~~TRINITY_DN9296_c0_g1_i4.p4  ORF type:complete len:136 (-),score=22.19 TRINITY_DN9296_c0_g1_i4:220-627(-)
MVWLFYHFVFLFSLKKKKKNKLQILIIIFIFIFIHLNSKTPCLKCTSETACLTCAEGYYQNGLDCLSTCNAITGTYNDDDNNYCSSCNTACKKFFFQYQRIYFKQIYFSSSGLNKCKELKIKNKFKQQKRKKQTN